MESPLMVFTSPLFHKISLEDCPGKDIPIRSSLQPCGSIILCTAGKALLPLLPASGLLKLWHCLTALSQVFYWMLGVVWQYLKKKSVGAGSRSLRLSGLLCKLCLHGPHSLHTGDKEHLLLKHKASTQMTFSQSLHKARQHGGILSFTGTMLFSTEREPTCSSWTSRG